MALNFSEDSLDEFVDPAVAAIEAGLARPNEEEEEPTLLGWSGRKAKPSAGCAIRGNGP